MNPPSPVTSRRAAFAALVALLALVGLVATAPASAKAKGCGAKVVSDWFAHKNRVQGHYPLHCYQEALDGLPGDVNEYTNARQVISAAAAAEALRCGSHCGPNDPSGPGGTRSGVKGIAYHNTYDFSGKPLPGSTIQPIPVSAASPSSVPVPLIVLAALAAVLMLAGGGGYVARRVKASRGAPPVTDP